MKILIFLWGLMVPINGHAAATYIQSLNKDWQVIPILSVGETANNGYRMVGIPDGMGAYAEDETSFTLLMNHEIVKGNGDERAHGAKGAFISKWRIAVETLAVLEGSDLIRKVFIWNKENKQFSIKENFDFSRLCSADLAKAGTFYDEVSASGYRDSLFLNGEEDVNTGRAFAHMLKGDSYELADLGKIQWENVVVNPAKSATTLLIGMDDHHAGGLLLIYAGKKRNMGNPVELAGLVGGKLYALKAAADRFSLVDLGSEVTGITLDDFRSHALGLGATLFSRPEDGAWDTQNYHNFYFATTDKIAGNPQIFELQFNDINKPEQGGKLAVILNGKDIGAQMFDNLTVDDDGNLLIQEDPGSHERLATIWQFDPKRQKSQKLFESNPD
ncbi:MAG: alkaline phosphatase PhoX, partial [Methylophilaceae bacterium]